MKRQRLIVGAIAVAALVLSWVLFIALPRWYGPTSPNDAPRGGSAPGTGRKIKATLFYISEDGLKLVGVERDVPYGESPATQARHIIDEQLKEAPAPLVSAIPTGTTLRAGYVTDRGEAFIDLSSEVASAHTGGSLDELFTVYTIVNALTSSLPAISSVQILIDGKEVDTLAGHVDLRHPLQKNMTLVTLPDEGATSRRQ